MAFIPVSSSSNKSHSPQERVIGEPRKQSQYDGNNCRQFISSGQGLSNLRSSMPTTKHRVNRLTPCAMMVDWLDLSSTTMVSDQDVLSMIPSFVLNQEGT